MTIEIEVSLGGFKQMVKFVEDKNCKKIYDDTFTICIIILYGKFSDICKYRQNKNILLLDDYNETFELLKSISDEVISINFNSGGGSVDYMIVHEDLLSNFQNLSSIFIRENDIFSVDNNKLLFCSDATFNYQTKNPDLDVDVCEGLSMKSLFDKTNFELIEYATIVIESIIQDNYYYSLKWISKMSNLKRLNLILNFSDKINACQIRKDRRRTI
jgi:hypothetical protein